MATPTARPSSRSSSRGSLVFGMVLAVPFALIGTALAVQAVWTVVSVTTMQAWPMVPATLDNVELRAASQNTERVVAAYRYVVQGRTLQGKRVSVYGADPPGTSQHAAYKKLEGYESRGVPYPAHVNPKNPADVILMPELRVQPIAVTLLFAALFGGLGWAFLGGGVLKLRKMRREDALVAARPNEPWRHRTEWVGPHIVPDEASSPSGAIFGAALWNLCASPMLIAASNKVSIGEYPAAALLMVFPAIGMYLIVWAGITVARARRFGKTYLELETMPGRQGGHLRGRVVAPAALAEAHAVEITVSCTHYTRNANAGRGQPKIRSKTLWQHAASAPVLRGQASDDRMVVPIDVALPDQPDSSWAIDDWHTWQVAAVAKMRGSDLDVEFDVPVFRPDGPTAPAGHGTSERVP